MSWDQRFDDPIVLPKGKPLRTLRDAGNYISKLPEQDQQSEPWQTATHCLLQAVDHGGPIAFARLGILQALFPKPDQTFDTPHKTTHWSRRKLARDQ